MKHYPSFLASLFLLLNGSASNCMAAQQMNERIPAPAPAASGSQDASAATELMRGTGDTSAFATSPTSQSDKNANGVSSAPGADAMMTRDLLLVNPNKTSEPPKPLQTFVGDSLKLAVDKRDILFHHLRGIMITVTNDTSRPLVIDGDNAKALVGGQTYSAIPVAVLQKSVLPRKSIDAKTKQVAIEIVPSAATIGATTTMEDYIKMNKPIRKRYGSDSQRRQAEASRFGKRILWPHEKTQGILYFKTEDSMAAAKVQVPVNTLFDAPDSAVLQDS